MTREWTNWHAFEHPLVPRAWDHPERKVAVIEDDLFADLNPEANRAAFRVFSTLIHVPEAIFVMPTRYPERMGEWARRRQEDAETPWPENIVPALYAETMADLDVELLRALCRIPARHRAIVASPRAHLAIGLAGTTPKTWGVGYQGIYNFIGTVVVRGPIGAGAWPMHPDWVRALRDECAGEVASFAFTRWGDFIPEQSYPPEINGCSKRREAWMDGGCSGPRPEPQGVEGLWWGTGSEREGRVITDWGAMDADGVYVSTWTGWRDSQRFCRVGAGRSGRLLDGREHLELPEGL